MSLAFRKRSRTKTGIYQPLQIEKYLGAKFPVYRSSYERAFFRFCDSNPNVLRWGSENIVIPYLNPIDKKIHRYVVDNFVLLREKEQIHKYVVEIKPRNQTIVPTRKTKKVSKRLVYEQVAYAENIAKWTAAKAWCQRNGCKFLILTEYDLGLKKAK